MGLGLTLSSLILDATTPGKSLLMAADAPAQRSLLGLGTAATIDLSTEALSTSALSPISKERNSGVAYLELPPADFDVVDSTWIPLRTWFTVALTPPDSDHDGTWLFVGLDGNRITYYPEDGNPGGNKAQSATTGTITAIKNTPTIPNTNTSTLGASRLLPFTGLIGANPYGTDFQGAKKAHLYIRPYAESMTALHVGPPDSPGADNGYPVIFGKWGSQGNHWLSDMHTRRLFAEGVEVEFYNGLVDYDQPYKYHGWADPLNVAFAPGTDYITWKNAGGRIQAVSLRNYQEKAGVIKWDGGRPETTPNSGVFDGAIRPAGVAYTPRAVSISGDNFTLDPVVGRVQVWTNSGSSLLRGMKAGVDGEIRTVLITGTGDLTILPEDGISAAADRIAGDFYPVVVPGDHINFFYIGTGSTGRWYFRHTKKTQVATTTVNTFTATNVFAGAVSAQMSIGDIGSGYTGIAFGTATPSFSNSHLFGNNNGNELILQAKSGGSLQITRGNDAGGNGVMYFAGSGRWGFNANRYSYTPLAGLDVSTFDVNDPALILRNMASQVAPTMGMMGVMSNSAYGNQAAVTSAWAVSTAGSQMGRLNISVYDVTTAREALRLEAGSGVAKLGALGATAVARQTVTGSRGANAALASLLTALASFGFITDSTS